MMQVRFDGGFDGWRDRARELLQSGVAPHQVEWLGKDELGGLFDEPDTSEPVDAGPPVRIPRQLIDELESAARFRTADRWSLLYRVLWRVAEGDQTARLVGDIDGTELHARIKAVRREAHHMHAFLRFSPTGCGESLNYAAWFEPAHDVLVSAAPHFAERMGLNSWLIAT
ncbi:MAG: TIGR03915 family putative DNA repair protein, partial [Gammaproteobacteria bacterium]|nr:TIGR03915 family putative DNA repair protein [Gammaproteobacteria bacterium]